MLFERMTQIMPDYNDLDHMMFIDRGDDSIVNYIMQVNATRNALYRATYNILIRIFLLVMENLNK